MDDWRTIIASSLGWEQAHVNLEHAVEGLPPDLRGRRPDNFPHSAWELLEHIRLAARDLADFTEDPDYSAPEWPAGYWPPTPAPPDDDAWAASLAGIQEERERLERLTGREELDLTARIPWGDGQTYLRTVLVAMDHESYHVGQIVAVRRLLGAWK